MAITLDFVQVPPLYLSPCDTRPHWQIQIKSLRLIFLMVLGNSNKTLVRMKHSSALVCVLSNHTFSQATQLHFTKIYPEGKGKRKAIRSSWDIMLYVSLSLI